MYRLLGDKVVDTEELIPFFEENGIHMVENITNATKRDDAVGLRIAVPVSELGFSGRVLDEEQMDQLMEQAEALSTQKLEGVLDADFGFKLYAYTYNEIDNTILINVVIMEKYLGRRKLPDVLKRLFDV